MKPNPMVLGFFQDGRWKMKKTSMQQHRKNNTMKSKQQQQHRKTKKTSKKRRNKKIKSVENQQIMCTSFKSNSPINDLPEEILVEVFKRLRVKFVLRCMCVQKSWYYLIKTPSFITLHRNHQNNIINQHPKYLFFQSVYTDLLTVRCDDRQCDEYYRFSYLPDLPPSAWFAQSYGLICVTYYEGYLANKNKSHIYLWNPFFQKYKTLPPSPLFSDFPELRLCALAFGFVPHINDYVVVHVVKPPLHLHSAPNRHSVKISVYSLNTDSWNTINQHNVLKACYIEKYHHAFVNGVAFWLGSHSNNHQIVMCFDTNTDLLREILLPDWVERTPLLGIHPFGQSIAYFVERDRSFHSDMWVLKGDSINDFSWEKKMRVKLSDGDGHRVEVLGLRNNGEPILFNLYNLVSYDLDSHKAKDFIDSWDRWDDMSGYEDEMAPPFIISPFVESLALLDLN